MPTPTPKDPIPFVTDDNFYYPPVSGKVYADSEDKYLRSVFVYSVAKNPFTGEDDVAEFAYLDETGTKPLWADMAYDLFKKALLVVFYTNEIEDSDGNVVTDAPFMFRVNGMEPIIINASVAGVKIIAGISELISPNRPSDPETEGASIDSKN